LLSYYFSVILFLDSGKFFPLPMSRSAKVSRKFFSGSPNLLFCVFPLSLLYLAKSHFRLRTLSNNFSSTQVTIYYLLKHSHPCLGIFYFYLFLPCCGLKPGSRQ
jgi:hypothetical protein